MKTVDFRRTAAKIMEKEVEPHKVSKPDSKNWVCIRCNRVWLETHLTCPICGVTSRRPPW